VDTASVAETAKEAAESVSQEVASVAQEAATEVKAEVQEVAKVAAESAKDSISDLQAAKDAAWDSYSKDGWNMEKKAAFHKAEDALREAQSK